MCASNGGWLVDLSYFRKNHKNFKGASKKKKCVCTSNCGWLVDFAFSRFRETQNFKVGVRQTMVDWLTWAIFAKSQKKKLKFLRCSSNGGWLVDLAFSRIRETQNFKVCACQTVVDLSYFREFAEKEAKISI